MAASVQFRPQNRDLGMVMREVDENLAIFLGIRNVEVEKNDHLLVEESHQFDDELKCAEHLPDSLLKMNASQAQTCLVGDDDNFLNLEMEMKDHDWLLKQPDTLLLPSLDADTNVSAASHTKGSNGEGEIPLNSEDVITTTSVSESSSALASVECCSTVSRRPSSTSARRAATPTGRPSTKSRPSPSIPTSRAALLPSSKPAAAQARSLTPVRPTSCSSTSASRPSIPVVSKSGTRSATPTRKLASSPTLSALDRSSSGKKIGATVLKSSVPSRGASPTVKSRSSKPSDLLCLSQDADHNPKKVSSMPKRPASASRGRLSSHLSSSSNEKPRQKSCSPARVRAPISTGYRTGSSKVMSRSRVYNNGGDDDVNPVVMGTKMVDRVVNMRKLAPPKQDEYVSQENSRKSSQENSGFGRSLSKKSLEMAIRHMDIRRSFPNISQTSAAGPVCDIQSGFDMISTAAAPESPQTSNSDSLKSST